MQKELKPGSWTSPLSARLLAESGNRNMWSQVVGDDLWWDETRPSESGRTLIVSRKDGDLLKSPWSASSHVHEYGGISWLAISRQGKTLLAFINKDDQRIYLTEPKGDPVPLTPAPPEGEVHRYIEMISVGEEIWCIRERHIAGEVTRDLVAITESEVRSLDSSSHFYSQPRVSHDGKYLLWICWEHPAMPWDGTEIKVAEISAGQLFNVRVLAGGLEESCLSPEWSSRNEIYYISDKSGWWNLWSVDLDAKKTHLITDESEWGGPLWQLGMRTLTVLPDDSVISIHGAVDNRKIVLVDPKTRECKNLSSELTDFKPSISAGNGKAYAFGGSGKIIQQLIEIDLATFALSSIVAATHPPIDSKYFPTPHEITAKRSDGRDVFAILHPAHHPNFSPSEKVPLIVVVHGGPTANHSATLDMEYAYFTSRGFSVVDVNYGGSTGYGRDYRNLLRGQWGVVDYEDVIAVVDTLIESGSVDPQKVLIRGGSAGGFTVLNALVHSKKFAAGATYYGVADVTALAADTHDFESRYLDSMIGRFPEDIDLYIERSPLTHAENLTSPLIIFQGLDDAVVPPSQSEAFRDICVAKGIKHRYISYEGEGHGFRQATSIISSIEAELTFYGEVLGFIPAL